MANVKMNEDKVALILGGIIFVLAMGKIWGFDALGWVVRTGMWVDTLLKAWSPAAKDLMPGYLRCWSPGLC